MGKVQCEYCHSFILDTDERCPSCGAPNPNHKRTTNDTPKTIEELKDWYAARNLPPENVTRFFIGKNITEPRAFGIYEQNGTYIVYKNKDNGNRAIRYEGTDEAYAVNELYLRLKEEILNQKRQNIDNRNSSQRVSVAAQKRRAKISVLTTLTIVFLFFAGFIGFIAYGIVELEREPRGLQYYCSDPEHIYYYAGYTSHPESKGTYDWWLYDENALDYQVFFSAAHDDEYPDGLSYETPTAYNIRTILEEIFPDEADIEELTEKYDIHNSHNYIDIHHYEPNEGYYYSNGKTYYYLNDRYGYSYGTQDNSGWYYYDNNDWIYYCDYNDKSSIGDDLWYNEDDYYISNSYHDYTSGNIYNFSAAEAANWNATDFENTDWYDEVIEAEKNHEEYLKSKENEKSDSSSSFWSSDSDYDWSSSDSWSSDSTDWGSDW